jgi:hypothetical protein
MRHTAMDPRHVGLLLLAVALAALSALVGAGLGVGGGIDLAELLGQEGEYAYVGTIETGSA